MSLIHCALGGEGQSAVMSYNLIVLPAAGYARPLHIALVGMAPALECAARVIVVVCSVGNVRETDIVTLLKIWMTGSGDTLEIVLAVNGVYPEK